MKFTYENENLYSQSFEKGEYFSSIPGGNEVLDGKSCMEFSAGS